MKTFKFPIIVLASSIMAFTTIPNAQANPKQKVPKQQSGSDCLWTDGLWHPCDKGIIGTIGTPVATKGTPVTTKEKTKELKK